MSEPTAEHAGRPTPRGFLRGVHPLAKVFGPVPAMVSLFFVRDPAIPVAFALLALALLLIGARPSRRATLIVYLGLPLAALVLSFSFGLWIDPERAGSGQTLFALGEYRFTTAMWIVGLGTGLRIVAMSILALIAGLTTTGAEVSRAMVQQLHVPYRVGYATLTAFTFVPALRRELRTVEAAHRVRGAARRGWIGRASSLAVPVLAGSIRRAERIGLTMDSRAFGAHRTRTERHALPFRGRDWAFMVACWAVTALVWLGAAIL